MVGRLLKPLSTKSFFLFGARGVGKTTWLETHFQKNTLWIDLLRPEVYDELLLDLRRFEQQVLAPENRDKWVIIDEVQRLPRILDVVQLLIQKHKRKFALTGSSARRLKQQGSNLMAGRALVYKMFPLSMIELGRAFDLNRALEFGGLPDSVFASSEDESRQYLQAYLTTYLEKEIQQEQWIRKMEPFRRFLGVAAQMNGKIINREKISREVGVENSTIASYYEVLEDTLLGFELPAFHHSIRKAQRQAPKFYFFDTGVKRAVERTLKVPLLPQTAAFGEAFEHWLILELMKIAEYRDLGWKFHYLRTKDDVEIDLVVERPGEPLLLIEIKSKARVDSSDAKALRILGKDLDPRATRVILSQDPLEQSFEKVRAVHYRKFLQEIGD